MIRLNGHARAELYIDRPRVARVFPRRTNATPVDNYAFYDEPGLFVPEYMTEVHISVVFTWDMPKAERLAAAWERVAPVKIGGPATGMKSSRPNGKNFNDYGHVQH